LQSSVKASAQSRVKDVLAIDTLLTEIHSQSDWQLGYRPENSRSLKDDVIGLVCGVVDGSQNVLSFDARLILEHLIERRSGPEKFQHIGNAETLAANTGPLPHLPSSTVIR
jgi:hypothetical protein